MVYGDKLVGTYVPGIFVASLKILPTPTDRPDEKENVKYHAD
jgi:hypothetical protein